MPWEDFNPPWMKVWDRFFLSASHADLTAEDFGIMSYCMMMANKHGRRPNGGGWVITAAGDPVDALHLARKLNVPDVSAVEKTLRRLCAVGTLRKLNSGVLEFPNLRNWQEDPSAERKRRSRKSERDSHADSHADSHVTTGVKFTHRGQRTEDRGEKSEEQRTEDRQPEGDPARAGCSPATSAVEPTTNKPLELKLETSPGPGDERVLVFPATGRGPGQTWALTRKHLDELIRAYPDLNVEAEMRKALAKINTGAVKKKTPRGYPKFVAGWLDRANDNPRGRARVDSGPTLRADPAGLVRSPTGEHNKKAFEQFLAMHDAKEDDA